MSVPWAWLVERRLRVQPCAVTTVRRDTIGRAALARFYGVGNCDGSALVNFIRQPMSRIVPSSRATT
jgi:hypothetical protein